MSSQIFFILVISFCVISLACAVLIPLAWAEKKLEKDRKKNSSRNHHCCDVSE